MIDAATMRYAMLTRTRGLSRRVVGGRWRNSPAAAERMRSRKPPENICHPALAFCGRGRARRRERRVAADQQIVPATVTNTASAEVWAGAAPGEERRAR